MFGKGSARRSVQIMHSLKNIVRFLLIGTISFFVSCKDHKETSNLSSVAGNYPTTTTSTPSADKTVSPCDTLNFLDLEILLSFQKEEFGELYQNILPYALSNEIRLVRNELFARKGYCFKDTVLQDYFTRQKWYIPKYSSLDSITLTYSENSLIDTLLRYEKLNVHLTRKSFRQLFLNEYLMKSDSLDYGIPVPWLLWTQAVYRNQQIEMSPAPWDYVGVAYSIRLVDKPYGYYHCILHYYCGAEGSGCYTYFVYVLDKELNVLDFERFNGWFEHKKVAVNKYKYSVSEGDYDEVKEVKKGFYKINKEGKIEYE